MTSELSKAFSRRSFLQSGVLSSGTIMLGRILGTAGACAAFAACRGRNAETAPIAPAQVAAHPGFLAAKLSWQYAGGQAPEKIILTVSPQSGNRDPIVQVLLPGAQTEYSLPVLPESTYGWVLQPIDLDGNKTVAASQGEFTTGPVILDTSFVPDVLFQNPRRNYYEEGFNVDPGVPEPLSPWYSVKQYDPGPPAYSFADLQASLPQPIVDGHPDWVAAYWYTWKTFIDGWNLPPADADNDAIAHICLWTGGAFGSTQVWDNWVMSHYARWGLQAYPFVKEWDNAYARQHENGFICQEGQRDNFEIYSYSPVLTPFLIGCAEMDYFQVSADVNRLRQVFMPLVKHYEWYMSYMRHDPTIEGYPIQPVPGLDAIYGFETPETAGISQDVFLCGLGMTAMRAAEALAMSRMAIQVGRPDMAEFFSTQYQMLGDYINLNYWDAEYNIYNDRCCPYFNTDSRYRDPSLLGKFITQPTPGNIAKSWSTFVPLYAEIVPPERVPNLKFYAEDTQQGFACDAGIQQYTQDTNPLPQFAYGNRWVWAPFLLFTQEGFKKAGYWAVAQETAVRHFNAILTCFNTDGRIDEHMDTTAVNEGQTNFCGWSGLAPVANLIEYILGIDLNMPQNTVTWHLTRTERHGLQNLKVGGFHVDLICDARATATSPCHLTITSGGNFTLQTVIGGIVENYQIQNGTNSLGVG